MDDDERVEVFNFRFYDSQSGKTLVSRHKATRECIKGRFLGDLLEGTGHKVSRIELDEAGLLRRVATGWGELAGASTV